MAVLEHHADLPLRPDYTLDQPRHLYSAEDHAVWRDLFRRQAAILPARACDEFLAGLDGLGVAADYEKGGGFTAFQRLSAIPQTTTVWSIVAVRGLVPPPLFFGIMLALRFSVTWCSRTRAPNH